MSVLSPEPVAQVHDPMHGVVMREPGMTIAWPANHCRPWVWDREILVGAHAVRFSNADADRHLGDFDTPGNAWFARSLDGGHNWTRESHPVLDNQRKIKDIPVWRGGEPSQPQHPLDFSGDDTAIAVVMQDYRRGSSCLVVSKDRGRTWGQRVRLANLDEFHQGDDPVVLPSAGIGVMARTDYDIEGPHTLNLFITAEKHNRGEGRVIHIRTTDGALSWRVQGLITRPDLRAKAFAIMPSTVRISPDHLISAVREQSAPDGTQRWGDCSIVVYQSRDAGRSWDLLSRPSHFPATLSSPPSMQKMADGRIVVTYAVRRLPAYIAARVSDDQGKTWSEEMIIRGGSPSWDIGYVRTAVVRDRLVSVYYWGDKSDDERYIARTIWRLPAVINRAQDLQ